MGLIFDTSEFIMAERRGFRVGQLLSRFPDELGQAVSVISIGELRHGVSRADTEVRRTARSEFLYEVLRLYTILPVTTAVALRFGDLDADLEKAGQKLDTADLLIAATALEYGHAVVTSNLGHFTRIPGLRVVSS